MHGCFVLISSLSEQANSTEALDLPHPSPPSHKELIIYRNKLEDPVLVKMLDEDWALRLVRDPAASALRERKATALFID